MRSSMAGFIENTFHVKQKGSSIKKEFIAGLTSYFAMSYIIFVNPQVVGSTGMDKGAIFTTTILVAAFGSILMGFLANYPIGIAPSVGLNAFFAYSVVLSMGIRWEYAIAAVLISSIIFVALTLSSVREYIINSIPDELKLSFSAGFGFFIAFVGLQQGGIIKHSDATLLTMGNIVSPGALLTIFGLVLILILILRKVPGAIFVGMVISVIVGLITKVIKFPSHFEIGIPSITPTAGVAVTNLVHVDTVQLWAVVFVFLLISFFDTTGSVIGIAERGNFFVDGKLPRMKKTLLADAISMVFSSLMGNTPAAVYIESYAGIAAGGRTGLTAIFIGICFIISLIFAPFLAIVTPQITAPVLIIIGCMMAGSVKKIDWDDLAVAIPSFLIIIGMPLTYNIT